MLRTTQPKRLVLLRHAKTVKNKQGKHGGGDETLTERGLAQIEVTSKQLSRLADSSSRYALFCQPDVRCVSSATVLGSKLSVYPQVIDELRGIDMGAVAGLSDHQLALRHPLVALSYLQWRVGSSLHRPHIKDAESIEDFAERSLRGLQALLKADGVDTIIFVGTTSGLLMLNHFLVHDGQFDRRDYRFYELDFDELATWQFSLNEPPQLLANK
jgi:broad specificity phosphatase PhoE